MFSHQDRIFWILKNFHNENIFLETFSLCIAVLSAKTSGVFFLQVLRSPSRWMGFPPHTCSSLLSRSEFWLTCKWTLLWFTNNLNGNWLKWSREQKLTKQVKWWNCCVIYKTKEPTMSFPRRANDWKAAGCFCSKHEDESDILCSKTSRPSSSQSTIL